MADQEIKLDLLGDPNQKMSQEDVFRFIEAKEARKRSASLLHDTDTIESASVSNPMAAAATRSSQYKRGKTSEEWCYNCVKPGHGLKAPGHIHKTTCPAWGKRWPLCRRENHAEAACCNKTKPHNESSAFYFRPYSYKRRNR
jgi:hypothetical protein